MIIGTFGTVVFETSAERIRTWRDFQRTGEARMATHVVMEQKPRLEFLGPGLDNISLRVKLDVRLGVNPAREIDTLREIRDLGEARQLILGEKEKSGRNLGAFVLVSMEEDWLVTDNAGRLLVADVTLKLKEYVERT